MCIGRPTGLQHARHFRECPPDVLDGVVMTPIDSVAPKNPSSNDKFVMSASRKMTLRPSSDSQRWSEIHAALRNVDTVNRVVPVWLSKPMPSSTKPTSRAWRPASPLSNGGRTPPLRHSGLEVETSKLPYQGRPIPCRNCAGMRDHPTKSPCARPSPTRPDATTASGSRARPARARESPRMRWNGCTPNSALAACGPTSQLPRCDPRSSRDLSSRRPAPSCHNRFRLAGAVIDHFRVATGRERSQWVDVRA